MKNLVTEDGENLAVRTFLFLYDCHTTYQAMKYHLANAGFTLAPAWVALHEDCSHITLSDAQDWIRFLFNLEKPAMKLKVEKPIIWPEVRWQQKLTSD